MKMKTLKVIFLLLIIPVAITGCIPGFVLTEININANTAYSDRDQSYDSPDKNYTSDGWRYGTGVNFKFAREKYMKIRKTETEEPESENKEIPRPVISTWGP